MPSISGPGKAQDELPMEKNEVSVEGGRGPWREGFHRLVKNRMALAGGIVILTLTLIAIFAPLIAPYPYDKGNFIYNYAKPGAKYLLGADFMGRDVLSRLIYGTRISLSIGILCALISFVIGVLYGTISGYYGGKIDNLMMRFVDISFAFPDMLFVILLMVVFRTSVAGLQSHNAFIKAVGALDNASGGMLFILIGIGLTSWVSMARLARGMALAVREKEYIEAARALGLNDLRIMFRHVIPNIVGPCVISVTLRIPSFIRTEAFLSFIGLGVNPPTPSWGMMIADGYKALQAYPHLTIFPGLFLAITMLSFSSLGDGLRDALDPRMKM